MKKIHIIILTLTLSSFLYAGENEKETYYFLFLSAKEHFLIKCENDSILKTMQPDVLQDIRFFEKNKMWEAAYYYISSYTDNNKLLPEIPAAEFRILRIEQSAVNSKKKFKTDFFIESGIDYSSQNFEILGLENDSLITQKITTPSLGLRWNTEFNIIKIQLNHSSFIKNDENYFTIDGYFNTKFNLPLLLNFNFKYYHLKDNQTSTFSFFQHEYDIKIGKNSNNFDWNIKGNMRFKNYKRQSDYLKNYSYKNLSAYSSKYISNWNITAYGSFLSMNRNKTPEFDREELIYLDFSYNNSEHEFQFEPEFRRYQYKHIIADSLEFNLYTDFVLNNNLKIPIANPFYFCNYSELINRQYQKQNENESNFIYFKLKPGIEWEVNEKWAFKLSAITEKEIHSDVLPEYEIDNFYSFGAGIDIEMLSSYGFIMLQYEYIHRGNNNFLGSISSFNHPANIHNINLALNIKLNKYFSLSGLINYDYDKNWKEGNLNTSQLVSLMLSYKLF